MRQAVPGTGYDSEQLRSRIEEIGDLRDEQEEQRFAEMTQDTDDGEDHAGEVAVGVSYEDFGWVPVVAP